eukprot:4366048-Pleurochrysis_carterae.AAC.1
MCLGHGGGWGHITGEVAIFEMGFLAHVDGVLGPSCPSLGLLGFETEEDVDYEGPLTRRGG